MKIIQSNGTYTFRASTWESSKGIRGYKGWSLSVWIPEIEHWYKLEGSHRNYPLHPDNAEARAKLCMHDAMAGFYDNRVREKVIGK